MTGDDGVDDRPRRSRAPLFPAYGPIDAVLGYVLFFVVVERATPTVTAALGDVLSVSPSLVGLGTAALLWFVLLVTGVEQCRRQLAALGVLGTRDKVGRGPVSGWRLLGFLAVAVGGGAVAAWTFEAALAATVRLIGIVAVLDGDVPILGDVLLAVVFFVAFGFATQALDRLVVGGLRRVLTDRPSENAAEDPS